MNGDDEIVDGSSVPLRYSRSERLKHASDEVRRMYEPDYIPKYGLLGGLVATRASRFVLFALALVFVLLLLSLVAPLDKKTAIIRDIPVRLETDRHDSLVYAAVLFDAVQHVSDIPLSVHITLTDSQKKSVASKAVHSFYMGQPLSIPVQFDAPTAAYVEAVIVSENKTARLGAAIP
ncbi:MAG: hypothetical protein ACTTJ7_07880 [Treponema sp.]